MPVVESNPQSILESTFGYAAFRKGQQDIVDSLLRGQDTLAVMPTGGGKSICYQIPALALPGLTIVISPLIALMQDQVEALQRKDVAVGLLNSLQSAEEQEETYVQLREGRLKLLYVAPERLRSQRFLRELERVEVSLLAIDEAHCLSQWGHDFRPEYMQIGAFAEKVGRPIVGAFTATATAAVRQDIIEQLKMKDQAVFISGFSRPNLDLRVVNVDKVAHKFAKLSRLIADWKTGIIYCATRKRVEEVMEQLQAWDIAYVGYHAGMSDDARNDALSRFVQGQVDVAVATNAFGMGIDRGDIRFVAHFELPGSVEAYYQEVGRAGRDGQAACCELYFNFADKRIQDFFIDGRNPRPEWVRELYGVLLESGDEESVVKLSLDQITEKMGKGSNGMAVGSALVLLAKTSYVERFDIPGQRIRGTRVLQPHVLPHQLVLPDDALKAKRERDEDKLKAMLSFIYSSQSRHDWILEYFGEKLVAENISLRGKCDNQSRLADQRVGSAEEVILMQKLLSGVARMSRKTAAGWHARFGKTRIIQVLRGQKRKELLEMKFDQLSTYGLLKEESENYVRALMQAAEDAQFIYTTGEDYPMVTLTALGHAVMMAKQEYSLLWPEAETVAREKSMSRAEVEKEALRNTVDYDVDLFNALRRKRTTMAKAMGCPAYQILVNKTLEDMARKKPKNLQDARFIVGVGDFKLKKYMPTFLDVIASHRK